MAKRSLTNAESGLTPLKKPRSEVIVITSSSTESEDDTLPLKVPRFLPILPGIPLSRGFLHGVAEKPVLWVFGFSVKSEERKGGRLAVFPLSLDMSRLAVPTYVTYRLVGHFQHSSSVLRQTDALVLVRSVPRMLHSFWVQTIWDLIFPPRVRVTSAVSNPTAYPPVSAFFGSDPPAFVAFPPPASVYNNLGFLQLSLLCFDSYEFLWDNPDPSYGTMVSIPTENHLLPVCLGLMLTPDIRRYIFRFIYALDIDFYVNHCTRHFLRGAPVRYEEEVLYSSPLPTVVDLQALLQSLIP